MTRAIVLHPDIKNKPGRRLAESSLGEAVALACALPGVNVVDAQVVSLATPNSATLIGSGKVAQLKEQIDECLIDLVLIDGEVSPVQQRNLEKKWDVKLLDRTGLILEIFADRARTREGVLQVELAALSYQRTRLVRAWTHLERQRGGLGFVGGPGETQIEADRRAIDEQILRLKRQLSKVVKTRELHRAARKKIPFPIVALVGYTNAGKSTLFNQMTKADVLAQNMLFATLDPAMRGLDLSSGQKVILSDTVGFISDLPIHLVAAFRATLEEVLSADLILHVRDISHLETAEQSADVYDILSSLGMDVAVPIIEVWNKLDLVGADAHEALLAQSFTREGVFPVSALNGEGIDRLLLAIDDRLQEKKEHQQLHISFDNGKSRAWLYNINVVDGESESEHGWEITVLWSKRQKERFQSLFG